MEFRTVVNITPLPFRITYADPVMFIGSCFASEIGSQLREGKMPVMINPAGTVFNPVSVAKTIDSIISGRPVTEKDLYFYNGLWHSFSHYSDFSAPSSSEVVDRINGKSAMAHDFLTKCKYLFVTFGTARVYRLKSTGEIVSNCHKMPSDFFERELLGVDDIVILWQEKLDKLRTLFPHLRVIFTISPVRHWKDGAHGNQVSKSVLFLAVEELLGRNTFTAYFPAYEILMDELRDYRFYDEDMLHPSKKAVDYIWEAFTKCYLDTDTTMAWKEAATITRALRHRITSVNDASVRDFASNMLRKIAKIEGVYPLVNLSEERQYFEELVKDQSGKLGK
jgi:hypothetical protein